MNVLITRPTEQGKQLTEALNQQGIFAIHQPLFEIEKGRELPLLPSALNQLNAGDYVFAVSRHAVDYAVAVLQDVGYTWRNDLVYLAVGKGSASHFCASIGQTVHYPVDTENSEGLLQLPILQDVENKKVLILRAETGRALFGETVAQRGAHVQTVECYRRVSPEAELSAQLSLCKRAGIDTIVITSSEALTTLFEQMVDEDRPWLLACQLIVVGQRIAAMAQQLGWSSTQISVVPTADNQTLFNRILHQM